MPPDILAQKNPPIPRMVIILVALLIMSVLFGVLYMSMSEKGENILPEDMLAVPESTLPAASTTDSLGGQIYEKAQNPLDGKLEAEVPAVNPINDAYKNPFE